MGYYGSVWAQPAFTSAPVTTAKVGISYAYNITVQDDPVPSGFTFELIDGPSGLSMSVVDSDEALLEGVPENAGTFNVTVRATNDDDAEFADQSC